MIARTTLRSVVRSSRTHAFSTSARSEMEIKTITVFGAGLMGAGIVQVAAQNGLKVGQSTSRSPRRVDGSSYRRLKKVMTDVSDAALDNGRAIITKSISRIAKKLHPTSQAEQTALVEATFANITTTTDAATAVAQTDLIIEAIVENLGVKQALFRRLDDLAPAHTIFASNTSSLSIKAIAETSSLERQTRFAGFHACVAFSRRRRRSATNILEHSFNPVPQMKLVEIVQADQTSDETRDALTELCIKMKKTPVNCKDNPGFIVNRLLVPYMLEAIRMVERGDATAADIDTAMKLGAGLPMGQFVVVVRCLFVLTRLQDRSNFVTCVVVSVDKHRY